MATLLEVLRQADDRGVAIGHFNASDLVTLDGIVRGARELRIPVVIGASEAEREFMGVRRLAMIVAALREEGGAPIFLNADHTHSLPRALEAARAGFDWVVCDFSSLPFEQNVRQTREAVEALKALRPDILVEGEIGDIGTGSQIHDSEPASENTLTTPDEAEHFVRETRVDTLAPAVGNRHGVLRSMLNSHAKKRLDIDRIRAIKERTGIFMTLHGGSDTDDEDLRRAIKSGVTVVHINTEIRLAWRRGLEASLAANKNDIAPYAILAPAIDSVKRVIAARLALFDGRSA